MPHRRNTAGAPVIRLTPFGNPSHDESEEGEARDEPLRHQGIPPKGQEVAENQEYQGDLSEPAHDDLPDV